jgi:type IV pilus assembly protein PilA
MNRIIRSRGRQGFTLIELLVVVLILAILMAVALPAYLNAVADSSKKTCRANMQTIANAVQAARVAARASDYSGWIGDVKTLVTGGKLLDLPAAPQCPDGGTYSVAAGIPFTVHCSIPLHDDPGNNEAKGYTPGTNSR